MIKLKMVISICCLLSTINIVLANEHSSTAIHKGIWRSEDKVALRQILTKNLTSKSDSGLYFDVNISELEQQLLSHEQVTVALPLPDGKFVTFKLKPSQVMHPELAAKYPSIKTFSGYQVNQPSNHGQFDITPQGFHAVFNIGDEQVFIDPSSKVSNSRYHNYYRKDAKPLDYSEFAKRLPPRKRKKNLNTYTEESVQFKSRLATSLTTYKLAITTTGEYGTFHGGTKEKTLAALVTLVNRLNDVYQRDLSMRFELVAKNDSIIYTDSATDPYANTDEDIDKTTAVINAAIGADNYDIGHIVGTGGGGLAGFQVVCTSSKAEGLTGSARPTSDSFYIDYVAHEIGHQFGADHTFNGAEGGCDGNRESTSAYEPGSASTIMGYAGLCGGQNTQNRSDPYFHIHSIDQIRAFTAPLANCGSKVSLGNNPPTVNAGKDYTIPAKTPFTLQGTATDPEGDNLSYSWEQFDLGAITKSASEDASDDGKRPLFRVFSPVNTAVRTFPKLVDILSNKATHGEALPSVARALNFRLIVRDNKNNLVDDAMKINVVAVSEGFSVNDISRWNSVNQTVTWQTANTEKAPVSCATVDILLSTDSGANFTKTLVSQAKNDGSQNITLTNLTTTKARIKVQCSDNIFFAINNADFEINAKDAAPTKPVFKGQQAISTEEDKAIVLNASMLNFENNPTIDSLQVSIGENYSVDDLKITPSSNFNGHLIVNMKATTSGLVSDLFQVKVDVVAVNDLPVAVADSATVAENASQTSIDVLANDNDVDGDKLILKAATTGGSGTVEIKDNKIVYAPAKGFSGTETISYTIEDITKASATSTLVITVTAAPVTPPTPTPPNVKPESKSSGGGSTYYLLFIALIAIGQRHIRGLHHG